MLAQEAFVFQTIFGSFRAPSNRLGWKTVNFRRKWATTVVTRTCISSFGYSNFVKRFAWRISHWGQSKSNELCVVAALSTAHHLAVGKGRERERRGEKSEKVSLFSVLHSLRPVGTVWRVAHRYLLRCECDVVKSICARISDFVLARPDDGIAPLIESESSLYMQYGTKTVLSTHRCHSGLHCSCFDGMHWRIGGVIECMCACAHENKKKIHISCCPQNSRQSPIQMNMYCTVHTGTPFVSSEKMTTTRNEINDRINYFAGTVVCKQRDLLNTSEIWHFQTAQPKHALSHCLRWQLIIDGWSKDVGTRSVTAASIFEFSLLIVIVVVGYFPRKAKFISSETILPMFFLKLELMRRPNTCIALPKRLADDECKEFSTFECIVISRVATALRAEKCRKSEEENIVNGKSEAKHINYALSWNQQTTTGSRQLWRFRRDALCSTRHIHDSRYGVSLCTHSIRSHTH